MEGASSGKTSSVVPLRRQVSPLFLGGRGGRGGGGEVEDKEAEGDREGTDMADDCASEMGEASQVVSGGMTIDVWRESGARTPFSLISSRETFSLLFLEIEPVDNRRR